MTILQVRRLLQKYPYLLNNTVYIRSYSEAKRMYAEGFSTFSNIIARAKEQSGLLAEAWELFEKSAEATEQKTQRTKARKKWISEISARITAHKRMAIAAMTLAIILAFFTLFPTGRALAKEMFDYLLNVFGYRIEIVDAAYATTDINGNSIAENNSGTANSTIEYVSIDEFCSATGLTPYVLNFDNWDCTAIVESNSETTGKSLRTEYQTANGDGVVNILQKWLINTQYDILSNGGFDNLILLSNGAEFHYAIDAIDGSLDGVCLLDDSMLWIHINKEPYISQVISFLQ